MRVLINRPNLCRSHKAFNYIKNLCLSKSMFMGLRVSCGERTQRTGCLPECKVALQPLLVHLQRQQHGSRYVYSADHPMPKSILRAKKRRGRNFGLSHQVMDFRHQSISQSPKTMSATRHESCRTGLSATFFLIIQRNMLAEPCESSLTDPICADHTRP